VCQRGLEGLLEKGLWHRVCLGRHGVGLTDVNRTGQYRRHGTFMNRDARHLMPV
jgi:hypothetical protein